MAKPIPNTSCEFLKQETQVKFAQLYCRDANGVAGPRGQDGINGTNGADGADGEQGPQGVPGNAATIAVGATTTSVVANATVTNTGTTSAAIFNFVIPRPEFTIGTVDVIAYGAPPTVTLTGAFPNYVLNFEFPSNIPPGS